MNHNQYLAHLKKNNLVETVQSLQHVLNASVYSNNIYKLRNMPMADINLYAIYGLNPIQQLAEYENLKNAEIQKAIDSCISKKLATGIFGTLEEYKQYLGAWQDVLISEPTKIRSFDDTWKGDMKEW